MVAVQNSSVFMQTLIYMMNQSYIQNENSYNYYFLQIGKDTNATKCYGIYGCFKLSEPWTSEHRPVSLFPEELEKIEPRYPMYTRKHRHKPVVFNLNDVDHTVDISGMDAMKPIYLIAHGYMEGGGIYWIKEMTNELLELHDCTVIVVDWHGGSSPPYTQAVANIRLVGAMTAQLLGEISRHTGYLKMDHVHCIGHSLGAHMCGYVGYTLQDVFNLTLGRISGMDPAEPHFAKAKRPVRLDRSAARYVDVVHTDASQFIRGGLGITESIGHVDYYPNGGTNQPGCGRSVTYYIKAENGSFFKGMRKFLGCNHMRSHQFFFESIRPKCSFMSVTCNSYQDFESGDCFDCGRNKEKCIPFGFHGRAHYEKHVGNRKRHTSLTQYLMTSDTEPFCRAHYRVTVQVSDSKESKSHGGEIGQLWFTMHSSTDGKGPKSNPAGFIGGYYEPGGLYRKVIATNELKQLKAVEVEWRYNSSLLNPLTWRLLTIPKIFLKKVTIQSLELGQSLTVCPKDKMPLISSKPQLLIPAYC